MTEGVILQGLAMVMALAWSIPAAHSIRETMTVFPDVLSFEPEPLSIGLTLLLGTLISGIVASVVAGRISRIGTHDALARQAATMTASNRLLRRGQSFVVLCQLAITCGLLLLLFWLSTEGDRQVALALGGDVSVWDRVTYATTLQPAGRVAVSAESVDRFMARLLADPSIRSGSLATSYPVNATQVVTRSSLATHGFAFDRSQFTVGIVVGNYLSMRGLRALHGRLDLTPEAGGRDVVIDSTVARELFGQAAAIGRHIFLVGTGRHGDASITLTIVGVVASAPMAPGGPSERPDIYVSLRSIDIGELSLQRWTLLVRGGAEAPLHERFAPVPIQSAIRDAITQVWGSPLNVPPSQALSDFVTPPVVSTMRQAEKYLGYVVLLGVIVACTSVYATATLDIAGRRRNWPSAPRAARVPHRSPV